jgi:serine/threonine protein kinase
VAGTPQYQAPEIFEQDTYDGLKADMFSIGVILFMIVIKSYPFKNSDKNDKFYRLIIKNTQESFEAYWDRLHERFCKRGVNIKGMSLAFKQLVFRLLCHNPDERITINELKHDAWLNAPDFSRSKTRKELAKLYKAVIN